MTVRDAVWLVTLVFVVAACDDPPSPSVAPGAPVEVAAEPVEVSREDRRLAALVNPPADVRPGELTADEAGHVVDLIAQLPDDVAFARLHAYGPGIGSAVAGLLGSDKPLDRVAGVKLTHGLHLTQHYGRLTELTQDTDARVRRSLTLALKDVGTDAQVHALVPLMDDPEFFIRLTSQRALAERGDRGLVDYARKVVAVERRVARVRAYQALADVAVPADADWFREQLARDDLDPSTEREDLWRGYATVDPERALADLARALADKKNPMGWHQYHNALRALAPRAPEELVMAEVDAQLPGAGKQVFGDLAQALSRTPGEAAMARAKELLGQDQWACEVIVGRLSAEKEWTAALARFEAEFARPEAGDKPALQARIAATRADLAWLKPLADAAFQLQRERLGSAGVCRKLGEALTPARLDGLVALLGDPRPATRATVADLLGRFGSFHHVEAIAAVLDDVDPAVRRKARLALRLQVGLDLRGPEGFLWRSWYVHTFGPLPAQHHPTPDVGAAIAADLAESLKVRPFDTRPKTTTDKGLQPRRITEPSSSPASGAAPRN